MLRLLENRFIVVGRPNGLLEVGLESFEPIHLRGLLLAIEGVIPALLMD